MSETQVTKDAKSKTLIFERLVNAPRGRVWQAWTDPEQLAKWWGPRGWDTVVKTFDFREGGEWHYGMVCNDKEQTDWYGKTSWGKAVYKEIDEPDSFAYSDYFCDENGVVSDDMPVSTTKMEFIETGDNGKQTRMVATSVFDTAEGYGKVLAMGVVEGLAQTWDRLEEMVETEPVQKV